MIEIKGQYIYNINGFAIPTYAHVNSMFMHHDNVTQCNHFHTQYIQLLIFNDRA